MAAHPRKRSYHAALSAVARPATNGRESCFDHGHEIVLRLTGTSDAIGLAYGAKVGLELDEGGGGDALWDEDDAQNVLALELNGLDTR